MAEIIKDGRTGDTAKIDVNNRMHTQSLSIDVAVSSALIDNAYDISTTTSVRLTDGTTTNGLLYIKNNETQDIIIDTIFVDMTAANNAVGSGTLSWVLNPTTGTVISDVSSAQIVNRRIGSPVNLAADTYMASAEAKTFTNGTIISFPFGTGVAESRYFLKPIIIPKGQAFGVTYRAPKLNTFCDVRIGILAILDTTKSA